MEGAVRHKDGGVRAGVRSKGKDTGSGSLRSCKDGIVGYFEATVDQSAVYVGQEGGRRVGWVREGVDVDASIPCRWLIGKLCDCVRTGF